MNKGKVNRYLSTETWAHLNKFPHGVKNDVTNLLF